MEGTLGKGREGRCVRRTIATARDLQYSVTGRKEYVHLNLLYQKICGRLREFLFNNCEYHSASTCTRWCSVGVAVYMSVCIRFPLAPGQPVLIR